jgi:hypothetical protein
MAVEASVVQRLDAAAAAVPSVARRVLADRISRIIRWCPDQGAAVLK